MKSKTETLQGRVTGEHLPKALPGLRYELVNQDRAPAINEFVNDVFELQREVVASAWKYFGLQPGLPAVGIAVEENSEEIVAIHPTIVRRLWVRDREVTIFQIADVAVSPQYRRGIALYRSFVSWVQLNGVMQGTYFGYGGLITEENRKIGKRLVGYVDLMQLETFERRLSMRLAAQRRFGRLGASMAHSLSAPLYRSRYKATQWGVDVSAGKGFDARYDQLWARLRDRYKVAIVRDQAVLNWRYSDNPNREFLHLEATRNGELVGYAVVRVWQEGDGKIGTLIDLLDGQEKEVCRALIESATAASVQAGCDFFRFAPCPQSCAFEMIEELGGFRSAPVALDNVVFKVLAPDIKAYGEDEVSLFLSQGDNWYYCQSDSDFQE